MMDSDDDQQEGQGGGGTQTALVGFLFGNVDANLQLEDDYLDGVNGSISDGLLLVSSLSLLFPSRSTF